MHKSRLFVGVKTKCGFKLSDLNFWKNIFVQVMWGKQWKCMSQWIPCMFSSTASPFLLLLHRWFSLPLSISVAAFVSLKLSSLCFFSELCRIFDFGDLPITLFPDFRRSSLRIRFVALPVCVMTRQAFFSACCWQWLDPLHQCAREQPGRGRGHDGRGRFFHC